MKTRPFATAMLAATFFLGACGEKSPEPLDVKEVALQAETNFRNVAGELARALAFLKQSRLFGSFLTEHCEMPLPPHHGEEGFDDDPWGGWGGDDSGGEGPDDDFYDDDFFDDDCSPLDLEARTNALIEVLSSRIFTEANVESNRDGVIVFRLNPAVTCADDDDCYETLSRLDLRLQVTSDAPGDLDIAVLVGSARIQPLVFGLHREDLTAEVDLAGLQRTLEILNRGSAPVNMAGRVQLGLARHDDNRFTASVSFLDTISVISVEGDDFHVEMAPALPAVSMQIDQNSQEVQVTSGLGRMNVLLPLSATPFGRCVHEDFSDGERTDEFGDDDYYDDDYYDDDCGPLEGSLGIRTAGLSGTMVLSSRSGVDEIHVDGLSLGPDGTIFELDGAQFLRVDLNESMNRKVDLVARAERSGVTLQFAPGLDLKLALNFIHLDRLVGMPAWTHEETLRIRLDGAEAPRIRLLDWADDFDWELPEAPVATVQVLAGTLHLESTTAGSVQVGEGMCLYDASEVYGEDDEPRPEHPFDFLSVDSCN